MRIFLWFLPCLAITAGCERNPVAETETVDSAEAIVSPAPSTPPTTDAATDAEAGLKKSATDSLKTENLRGVWEVVGVASLEGDISVFSKDDPLILKSRMEIDSGKLSWQSLASDEFTADDRCQSPDIAALPQDSAYKDIQKQLSAAASRLGQKTSAPKIYGWSCDEGGNWGPEADGGSHFLMLENGQMVTSWYDNVALLLRRSGGT